ncbi:tyrosine-type recombinase/integrase, partial [Patescibacteria group bacterium]|nr:tyrosine-type recombinase/integrase [Patescibacteria group bacterium]
SPRAKARVTPKTRPQIDRLLTEKSIEVIKNAAKRAEINKRVHCHMLRASFATHLLEQGINESYIQKLMGHASIKTLQRYLAVRVDDALKVKSPLDNL